MGPYHYNLIFQFFVGSGYLTNYVIPVSIICIKIIFYFNFNLNFHVMLQ